VGVVTGGVAGHWLPSTPGGRFVGRWNCMGGGGMLMIRGLWSSCAEEKETAMIFSAEKSRPRLANQRERYGFVSRSGWMQCATMVRMRRALCVPMEVRKEAE
jgi:hypothetical protein